jgi:hypothetical protein
LEGFSRLEAEDLECVLADAKEVKHLPGRRTPIAGQIARYRMRQKDGALIRPDSPAPVGETSYRSVSPAWARQRG